MRVSVRWQVLPLAVTLLALVTSPTRVRAQGTGSIEGTVTDAGSGRPLQGARLSISGTQLGATTNDQGTFRITGVPARQIEMRVRMLGYKIGRASCRERE